MTTPIPENSHASYLTPQQRAFHDYLARNPEHEAELKHITASLYGKAISMGLPANEACVDLIKEAMNFTSGRGKTPADVKLFNFLTQRSEYGEVIIPEDVQASDELVAGAREAYEQNEIPDFLRESFERQALKAIKNTQNQSQGLTPAALSEINQFFTQKHLKPFAEIVAGASAEALLDDELLKDIAQSVESIQEANLGANQPLRTTYAILVGEMNYWASSVIEDDLTQMFENRKDLRAGRTGLSASDLTRILQEPDDPSPRQK